MHAATATLPSYRELRRRYWKWEAAGVGLIVVGIAVSWVLLLWFAAARFAVEDGEVYWLSPSTLLWGVPAFFAGILAATWPTDVLYRRLLGDRYPEFRSYQIRKFGYDARTWMPLFYLVFGTATAAVIVVMLDCYVRFGPSSIEVDALWSREQREQRRAHQHVEQWIAELIGEVCLEEALCRDSRPPALGKQVSRPDQAELEDLAPKGLRGLNGEATKGQARPDLHRLVHRTDAITATAVV